MRRLLSLLFVCLFPLCVATAAQINQSLDASVSRTHLHADCGKLNSPGCKSFNDMAATNNPDLEDILEAASHSLVCFRPGEDVFFVLAYDQPKAAAFTGQQPGYRIPAVLNFERFKSDAGDVFQSFTGSWRKEGESIEFSTEARYNEPNTTAEIRPGKVRFIYQYPEMSRSDGSGPVSAAAKTTYALIIHLPVLRFEEDFTSVGSAPKSAIHKSGSCVSF